MRISAQRCVDRFRRCLAFSGLAQSQSPSGLSRTCLAKFGKVLGRLRGKRRSNYFGHSLISTRIINPPQHRELLPLTSPV
jgi:hypothetical protein